MELSLQRDQNKKMMGGVSFQVRAEVSLTPKEEQVVNENKLHDQVLFSKQLTNIWGTPIDEELNVTVGNLLNGETYKCNDVATVIAYSESLKDACETLKGYIDAAKTFGGEETYEF